MKGLAKELRGLRGSEEGLPRARIATRGRRLDSNAPHLIASAALSWSEPHWRNLMAATFPALPVKLTKTDWDKNKGAVAKLAGETGMGAQMDKVKKAWDTAAAQMNVLDGPTACPPNLIKNSLQVAPKLTACKNQFDGAGIKNPDGVVSKLRVEVNALRDLAKTTAAKFKSNPLIPKTSTEHALGIEKEADFYSVALMINGVFAEMRSSSPSTRSSRSSTRTPPRGRSSSRRTSRTSRNTAKSSSRSRASSSTRARRRRAFTNRCEAWARRSCVRPTRSSPTSARSGAP